MFLGKAITKALAFALTFGVPVAAYAQQGGDNPCDTLATVIRGADIKVRPQGFDTPSGWPEGIRNNPMIEEASVSAHPVAEAVDQLRKSGKVSAQLEQQILKALPDSGPIDYSTFGPEARHAMLSIANDEGSEDLSITLDGERCNEFVSLSKDEAGEWTASRFTPSGNEPYCWKMEFSLIKVSGKSFIHYSHRYPNSNDITLLAPDREETVCRLAVEFRRGYAANVSDRINLQSNEQGNDACHSDLCKSFALRGNSIAKRILAGVELPFTRDRLPKDKTAAILKRTVYVDTESLNLVPEDQDTTDIRAELKKMTLGGKPKLPAHKQAFNFKRFENQMWFVGDISNDMDYFGYNLNTGAAFRINSSAGQESVYELRYLPLPINQVPPTSFAFNWAECAYWECKIEPFVADGNLYFFRYGKGWSGKWQSPGLLFDVLAFDRGITKRIVSGSLNKASLGPPKKITTTTQTPSGWRYKQM